jgi:DNA-directed RNA polymerase subunit alpha
MIRRFCPTIDRQCWRILTNMAINKRTLDTSVDDLKVSMRTRVCLGNANILTVGELVQKTEEDLLRTQNCGRMSIEEIKSVLAGMGLALGMKIDEQGNG